MIRIFYTIRFASYILAFGFLALALEAYGDWLFTIGWGVLSILFFGVIWWTTWALRRETKRLESLTHGEAAGHYVLIVITELEKEDPYTHEETIHDWIDIGNIDRLLYMTLFEVHQYVPAFQASAFPVYVIAASDPLGDVRKMLVNPLVVSHDAGAILSFLQDARGAEKV